MIDYVVRIGEYRYRNCKDDFAKADKLCVELKPCFEDVHILAERRKGNELHH